MIDVSTPGGIIVRAFEGLRNPSAHCKGLRPVTALLKESICDFQLEFAHFMLNSSMLHRDFRNNLNQDKLSAKTRESFIALEDGITQESGRLYYKLLDNLNSVLLETHHSNIRPRVSFQVFEAENEYFVQQCSAPWFDSSEPKNPEDYDILNFVKKTGTPYLCNNIPRTIIENIDYRHGGFNVDKIRNEYPSNNKLRLGSNKYVRTRDRLLVYRYLRKIDGVIKNEPAVDNKWLGLTEPENGQKIFSDGLNSSHLGMYKSHLAIPVTFKKHAPSLDPKSRLHEILQTVHLDSRTLLGVLLFDHVDPHYFDERSTVELENIDVNLGYIYADLMSFIFIVVSNYLAASTTVADYKRIFEGD